MCVAARVPNIFCNAQRKGCLNLSEIKSIETTAELYYANFVNLEEEVREEDDDTDFDPELDAGYEEMSDEETEDEDDIENPPHSEEGEDLSVHFFRLSTRFQEWWKSYIFKSNFKGY